MPQSGRRPQHQSRQFERLLGMSAFAPIATELLRYGNRRNGPLSDISGGLRQFAEQLLRLGRVEAFREQVVDWREEIGGQVTQQPFGRALRL